MTKSSLSQGCRIVKLAEVAIRVMEKHEASPSSPEPWVGADHLDEGDLRIKRWSMSDDPVFPPTFKFKYPIGAVLIHSRNPKKVALADFSAITGEKIFALSSRDESILSSRFLAYVLQSARFEDFTDEWMTGSVNKFLNWSALEKFEFPLPPIAEQRRVAELIASIDNTISSYEALELEILESALVTAWLNDPTFSSFSMDLKDLVQNGLVELGRGDVISKKDIDETPGDFPVYSSAQQDDGKIGSYGKYMFDEELITWSIDGGGYIFHRPKHKFSVTNIGGYLRILVQEKISYQYLAVVLRELHRREVFDWQNKAHPSVLQKKYKGIPVPSIDIQNILVEKFALIHLFRSNRNLNVVNLKQIRKSFLSDLLD